MSIPIQGKFIPNGAFSLLDSSAVNNTSGVGGLTALTLDDVLNYLNDNIGSNGNSIIWDASVYINFSDFYAAKSLSSIDYYVQIELAGEGHTIDALPAAATYTNFGQFIFNCGLPSVGGFAKLITVADGAKVDNAPLLWNNVQLYFNTISAPFCTDSPNINNGIPVYVGNNSGLLAGDDSVVIYSSTYNLVNPNITFMFDNANMTLNGATLFQFSVNSGNYVQLYFRISGYDTLFDATAFVSSDECKINMLIYPDASGTYSEAAFTNLSNISAFALTDLRTTSLVEPVVVWDASVYTNCSDFYAANDLESANWYTQIELAGTGHNIDVKTGGYTKFGYLKFNYAVPANNSQAQTTLSKTITVADGVYVDNPPILVSNVTLLLSTVTVPFCTNSPNIIAGMPIIIGDNCWYNLAAGTETVYQTTFTNSNNIGAFSVFNGGLNSNSVSGKFFSFTGGSTAVTLVFSITGFYTSVDTSMFYSSHNVAVLWSFDSQNVAYSSAYFTNLSNILNTTNQYLTNSTGIADASRLNATNVTGALNNLSFSTGVLNYDSSSGATLTLTSTNFVRKIIVTGTVAVTITLPTYTSLPMGADIEIDNQLSNFMTVIVKSYGANTIDTIQPGYHEKIVLKTAGDAAANWYAGGQIPFTGIITGSGTTTQVAYFNASNTLSGLTLGRSIINNTGTLQLSGDASSPGNNYFYGTNGSGTKGWQALGDVTYTTLPVGCTSIFGALSGVQGTSSNVSYGYHAGNSALVSGSNNVCYGSQAGASLSSGNYNTCISNNAGNSLTTQSSNTLVGYNAGVYLTAASATALGTDALLSATTGGGNAVALGANALLGATTGGLSSIAIGYNAASKVTTTNNEFFVGNIAQANYAGDIAYSLMYGTFSGVAASLTNQQLTVNAKLNINGQIAQTGNVRIGTSVGAAGGSITTGSSNVVIGQNSGGSITNQNYNTFVGDSSGAVAAGSYGATAIGSNCLMAATTGGSHSTAIGQNALAAGTTGITYCVALGYYAGYNTNASNEFYVNNIQQSSYANDKSYSLMYGTFSGVAGSLIGQQLAINGAFSVSGASTITGGLKDANVSTAVALGDATHTALPTGCTSILGALSGVQASASNVNYGYLAGHVGVLSGASNSCYGYQTGQALTTGSSNCLFGYDAGDNITGGSNNICIGSSAGAGLGTASNNVLIGYLCGNSLTSASVTAMGWEALYTATSGGDHSVTLGNAALYSATTGALYSVALGNCAGYNVTTTNGEFFVNNTQQANYNGDKAYSLMYGTFSGTAGSLANQSLRINGTITLNGQTTVGAPLLVNGGLGDLYATSAIAFADATHTTLPPNVTSILGAVNSSAIGFATQASVGATNHALTSASARIQEITGVAVGDYFTLPAYATMVAGNYFIIQNVSTQDVIIKTNGANALKTLAAGYQATVYCRGTSDAVAGWNYAAQAIND